MTAFLPDASPSLVGRDREQDALRRHMAAALAGHGSLALIGGEAGIGKTALAEAACAEAAERGALVLIGRCYDLSETPPYGPWIELFARYRQQGGLPPLPDAFARRGTVGEVTSQAALFQQALDFFTALAEARPLVLLLDDLHWADPASLDLLRFLARSVAAMPLLILATYRADELTRRHPLYQLLPTLVREAHADRLDLQRIEEADIRALVAARYALPSGDTARLVAYLHARSEGNPFFLGELLRTLEAERILRRGDGWALGNLTQIRVPALLRQVIDGRLARLGEEAQRLLAVAAVIGQEVPLALWAAVAETDEESVLSIVEPAIEAHVLEGAPDGARVRFAHALIREALYEGILPMRRRTWHRQAGEALIAQPHPDPDAVAHHFQQARDERAAEWLVRVGVRARQAYAYVTAATRFEAALALLAARDAETGARGWLLYHLARLRRYTEPRRGIAYLDEAIEVAAIIPDTVLDASARFERGFLRCVSGNLRRGIGEMKEGVAALQALSPTDQAQPGLGVPGPTEYGKFSGQATLAVMLADAGRFIEARTLGERIVADPPDAASGGTIDGSAFGDAWRALAESYAALGLPDAARRANAEAREAYEAVGHHLMVGASVHADLYGVVIPYQTDRLAERARLAAAAEQTRTRSTSVIANLNPRFARVSLLLVEGAWVEVERLTRETNEGLESLRRFFRGSLASWRGERDLAWQLITATLPGGPMTEPGDTEFHPALGLQRAAVTLALDAGDLPVARAWLAAQDRWLTWSGAVLGRAECALGWAAYHRAAGDPACALQHANQALAHATEPRQPLALLAAHRLLGELATDAGHYGDATTHLDAALALADACAVPFERALTLLALA